MPSLEHEALIALFRYRPSLAAEIVRDVLGVPLPAFASARVESSEVTEVVPATFRADLTIALTGAADLAADPVHAIVVEVQLTQDTDKRMTWPYYVAAVRARLECPTSLLIVTASESVERWARTPIELGHPGLVLAPIVLGPRDVPRITDPAQAAAAPELAVLSALAHADREETLDIARAAIGAVLTLDEERVKFYSSLVLAALGDAARAQLEEAMRLGNYPEPTDLEKRILARGRAEGEAIGRAEGEAIGRAEGEAVGEARALLKVLEARGIDVADAVRERVLACADLTMLDLWLARALTATRAEEVFGTEK